ncbi:putative membrane protein [Lysinibacillus sp. RC79]
MTEEKIKKLQIPSTIILVLFGFYMVLRNNILLFPYFLILLSLSLFLISLRLYFKKYNPILRSFIIIICFILIIIAFQNIFE